MNKFAVTLNIGENVSGNFGVMYALIRTQDESAIKRALYQIIEYMRESKGFRFDFDKIKVAYANRKVKHGDADLENTFVVEFEACYDKCSFDAQDDLYNAIGMMATYLFQEAIAFSVSYNSCGRKIRVLEALAGLYKHLWGGGVFDRSQFITLEQAEKGEF